MNNVEHYERDIIFLKWFLLSDCSIGSNEVFNIVFLNYS